MSEDFTREDEGNPFVDSQPDHGPGQIRRMDDLKEGQRVIARYRFSGGVPLTVVTVGKRHEDPAINTGPLIDDPRWVIAVTDNGYTSSRSLADLGVLPYENGEWNRWNFLQEASEQEADVSSQA